MFAALILLLFTKSRGRGKLTPWESNDPLSQMEMSCTTSSESPIYQRHRVRTLDSSPYIGARALGVAPNAHNTVGPYWFPDHLSTRRPEEFPLSDIFNRQPISNQTS
ncbi:hypothetical protein NECAME_12497, partial [Necator americanus]